MAMISAYNLTRRFGDKLAVEDLSLEVAEGELLAFLGPNGAGKTTTIRLLAGIIAPTSGYAVVAGWRADRDAEKLHEVIGLLTEAPGFYEHFTARRNLEYFAGFYNAIDAGRQVEKYLKMLGLWDRRDDKVGTYSKGMKQRLALARALLHEPKVLFLDEPTSGLDPEAAREVRDFIKQLSREGRTIFLSTHNLTEAEMLCQRIAIVKTRLLTLDTPETLRHRLFRRRVVVQLASVPAGLAEKIGRLGFVRGIEAGESRLSVELDDAEQNRPALVEAIVGAGGQVMGVGEEAHSLEEVYLSLVHESGNG
jgi:ABC-2 type transport system ATP-binding protein